MRWRTSHGRTDLWSGEGRNFRAWLTSRSRNRRTKITRDMGLALLVAVIAVMLITVTPSCGHGSLADHARRLLADRLAHARGQGQSEHGRDQGIPRGHC